MPLLDFFEVIMRPLAAALSRPRVPDGVAKAVKLIHADDLRDLARLPRYQDCTGIRYADYLQGAARIRSLKRDVRPLLDGRKRLAAVDHANPVPYHNFDVEVGPAFLRGIRQVALPAPEHEGTIVSADAGSVGDCTLSVKAGWRPRTVRVSYAAPSSVVHAAEIAKLRATLLAATPNQRDVLSEIDTSRFEQPVLFVSHRWEATDHPDPHGRQLEKLRELRNCYVIYDYCSFPQDPLEEALRADLDLILSSMGDLVRNVVILDSPGYAHRGWCLYEYIVSSLVGSVVCDEVRLPELLSLRNWAATRTPAPDNVFRDSFESRVQNYVNERVLSAVNEVLPAYGQSSFTHPSDRTIVDDLLVTHLKTTLHPAKNTRSGTVSGRPCGGAIRS